MGKVVDHLLALAADYERRSIVPSTAWDCLGAESWAKACREFAGEVHDLNDADAIAWLKRRRDNLQPATGKSVLPNWYYDMDFQGQMDLIIDPIARDRRGWIEFSDWTDKPSYRRYLGINHGVGYCGRGAGESEAAWAARRNEWLARYNDGVWVTAYRFGSRTPLFGTVGEVLQGGFEFESLKARAA